MPRPTTVLFLGANPFDTTRLALDREMREIDERLRSFRDAFRIEQAWAVRATDLQERLLRHRPTIVHFSGHGSRAGELLLEDETGAAKPVTSRALSGLFRTLRRDIRCIVLNACHSEEQARAIVEHIDCVVGMTTEIEDRGAIAFAGAFYQALGYGEDVQTAFDLGCNQMALTEVRRDTTYPRDLESGEARPRARLADVPRLLVRDGVRAQDLRFAEAWRSRSEPEQQRFVVPFLQNPRFVGRNRDLEQLHALLQRSETVGVGPAALTGMGGIGKTQLAVEYAYRHRAAYPGGVYWVNAAKPWQTELAALAEKVGLREDDAPEAIRERRLARAFAAHLTVHPGALVIFDNVEDPLELQNASLDIVPTRLACSLLFTTRRREMPYHKLDVGVLDEPDALALLLSSSPRSGLLEGRAPDELRMAIAICRTLGHLPLAITLATAYLDKHPRIPLAGYLSGLEHHGALVVTEAGGIDPRLLATQHEKGVKATLEEQWTALRAGGEGRRVLETAALLGEAAQVPRARLALLTGLSDLPEGWREAPLEEALQELAGLSLVEKLTEQEIRLHPLVRLFVEQQIEGRQAFTVACVERLGEALWDMGRLHEEVAARGVDAVLGDLQAGSKLAGTTAGQGPIAALIRPLDRESHHLRRWDAAKAPGFFLQQLRNQCSEMGMRELQERAEAKLEDRGWSWLRERIRANREPEALVRTLEGHNDSIVGVAVTSDGRFAVSVSEDGILKVWDLETGQAIRTLKGHAGVTGVVVTLDGRFAVSASEDSTLRLWDLGTGQAIRTLKGHTGDVRGVAVTSDSCFAISASEDSTLRLWDLGTGQAIRTLKGHTGPVNDVAVTSDGRFAVSASEDSTLKLWDLGTGQAIRTLKGHAEWFTGVAVASDGSLAVSATVAVQGVALKVWDLGTGRAIHTLNAHTTWVSGLAVTSDGRFAVSTSREWILKVWDLERGRAIRTLEGSTSSRDTFSVVRVRPVSAIERINKWRGLGQVAVTSDGRFAVSASDDKTLKVWDLGMELTVRAIDGHPSRVRGVAVTSDSRFAVSASDDKTLKVWDLETGQAVRTIKGHTHRMYPLEQAMDFQESATDSANGVAVTSDGRFVVSASNNNTLTLWDFGPIQTVRTLDGHTARVNGVAVMSDGRFAVSASDDKTLKVWDLGTRQAVRTLEGHTGYVSGVAMTPDGRFAVSASDDKTLKVWDLETGQAIHTLEGHAERVNGVAVTSDGRFAVSASDDKTLKVWDLRTDQPITILEIYACLECCAVAPDTRTVLAGDAAGALHILDWRNAPRPRLQIE